MQIENLAKESTQKTLIVLTLAFSIAVIIFVYLLNLYLYNKRLNNWNIWESAKIATNKKAQENIVIRIPQTIR